MKTVPLSPEEIAATAFPGGRLPVANAKNVVSGGDWTPIGDASPAAIAAAQERQQVRAAPKGKGR